MTQAQLDHEVAYATGESIRTVHRLGFSVVPDGPAEPEPLYLVIDCPHCRKPAPFPGQLADGSCPLAECPACDALFAFDLLNIRVEASCPA
ncbi:MAG: hypothetical protein LC745_09010 [Planctomycetia bacterium]|nr:hypothetical protein [Planctomycetia bacterium]